MDNPYADLQEELDALGYRSVVRNFYAWETRSLFVGRGADEIQACWVTLTGGEWYVGTPGRRMWRLPDAESAIASCLFLLQSAAQRDQPEFADSELAGKFDATPVSEGDWFAKHAALRCEMHGPAWRELPRAEEDAAWREYESRFGVWHDASTVDARLSSTWSLTGFYARPASQRFVAAASFRETFVLALNEVLAAGEQVLALDWNHPCYRFDPRRLDSPRGARSWPISPLPDRDPGKFVAPDYRFGWLTFMDDRVIAVGQPFVDALRRLQPVLLYG